MPVSIAFNGNGILIETIVDKKVYIVRGYNAGESYPSSYTSVMVIVIEYTVAEIKATIFRKGDKPRISQFRALRRFLKGLGCIQYLYEESIDGQLVRKLAVL